MPNVQKNTKKEEHTQASTPDCYDYMGCCAVDITTLLQDYYTHVFPLVVECVSYGFEDQK